MCSLPFQHATSPWLQIHLCPKFVLLPATQFTSSFSKTILILTAMVSTKKYCFYNGSTIQKLVYIIYKQEKYFARQQVPYFSDRFAIIVHHTSFFLYIDIIHKQNSKPQQWERKKEGIWKAPKSLLWK
jgi:hypothetical protein